MKKILAITLVAIAASCSSWDPISVQNENTDINSQEFHSWNNYHWARRSEDPKVNLQVNRNLSQAWLPFLTATATDWNASTVIGVTVAQGYNNPRKCNPTAGQVEVCNASYGQNGWLGLAQIWFSNGHITQATMKLNDSYFNMTSYNTAPWKNLVMCQELAHTFGLDHQDEEFANANLGTCMDYTNNPLGPPSNERPNTHDYEELEAIYAHTGTEEIAPTPRTKRNGRLTKIERLGRDEFLVTHIYPAN